MAEVIPTRREWQQPEYNQREGDNAAYFAGMEALDKKLEELNETGRVARFPRGDGYAYYYVAAWHPLQLEHIPASDAYTADPVLLKGLELADLKRYGVTAEIPAGVKLKESARLIPGSKIITEAQLAANLKAPEYTVTGHADVPTRDGTYRYTFTAQMQVEGLLVHRYTIIEPLVVSEVPKDKLRAAIAVVLGVPRRFVKW